MKKKVFALLLALLVPLTLSACGGGKNNMVSTDSAPQGSAGNESSEGGGNYYGWAEEEIADAAPETPAALPTNTKMIYTADLELETQDFDAASAAITQITEELGGWFESRQMSQGGSRYLYCVIRVPVENFSALLDRAGAAAHLVSRSEETQDISEAYYDSEARLATQRTKLERLQVLLAQAATMEDIISLETALSETELEIERLTGTLRRYDSLVGYSTVTLRLGEVYRLSGDEEVPATFGQRLTAAFALGLRRGVAGFEDFVIGLARNWVSILVWLAVIAVGALAVRGLLKRRRTLKAAPLPPPEDQDK